ncbi:MAG: hypothetical protein AABY10_01505 [Nanoarchaeota archaeon]
MDIKILKQEKNGLEFTIDSITVAEILRVYLNKNNTDFAAWRRVHPDEPLLMKVESSGKNVVKEISEAVEMIKKDLNKIQALVKK